MPRFDPSPWNLGLPVCAIAAACGPVIPLEPMGPTSLGETDPVVASTSDDGASMDAAGCVPPCLPGYVCDAGVCVPEYGCLEFGCCYDDPCCLEGGYGCGNCYYPTDCASGSFCEYGTCLPLEVPEDCYPLALLEVLGPTPIEIDSVFSLAFVESDDDVGRELVIGDENGAVIIGGPGEAAQVLPIPEAALVEDIAVADFDVDGREDIAISMTPPASLPQLVILQNAGDDTFIAFEPATSAAFDIVAGDVDGNGFPDIVGALDAGVEFRPLGVLLGVGGFTFEPTFLDIDAQPLDIAIGDLDGNGLSEVVGVANDRQQVWYGADPYDNAADWGLVDVPFLTVQVVLDDFDANGYDDLVRLTNVNGWTMVDSWAAKSNGVFETVEWGALDEARSGTALSGNLAGDGNPDLVYLTGSTLHVRFGAGVDELFGCVSRVDLSIDAHIIAMGDFTGEGVDDVAVSNGAVVHVYSAPAVVPP